MHLQVSPSGLGCCPFLGGGSVVVESLFIVAPIVCIGSVFGPSMLIQLILAPVLVMFVSVIVMLVIR